MTAGKGGLRLLRGGAKGFVDVTEKAGLAGVAASAAVAGDYDNDGLPDLLVSGPGGVSLRHNEGGLRFAEEKAPLPAFPHPVAAAAFVDIDHDGDLDVFVSAAAADGPALLLQNNGDRTFADITATAQLAVAGGAVAVVPTDFDNRRDVDLFVLKRDRPALFKNVRDGSFKDLAAELGLVAPGPFRCAAAGDVNKDGYTDFFLGAEGESSLALSDGRGAFRVAPAPKAAAGALAAAAPRLRQRRPPRPARGHRAGRAPPAQPREHVGRRERHGLRGPGEGPRPPRRPRWPRPTSTPTATRTRSSRRPRPSAAW